MNLYFSPDACSLVPQIALLEAGCSFDLEKVGIPNKKTASGTDYWQINPKGYVPALQLYGGELLSEVGAILQCIIADQKLAAGTMARVTERPQVQSALRAEGFLK